MLTDYYKKERARIVDLAARFCRTHPDLEPLMADPAIERLFEGTAFLCALLQMKLDDDLPEIIHDVMRNVQLQHLRPIPACTIIAFTPKPNCTGTRLIPKGTEVASVPVDGTSCRFTTVYPVEIHPLALVDASFSQPSTGPATIALAMEFRGIRPADWQPETVRLFLSGEYGRAADILLLLARHLRRIVIDPGVDGRPAVLEPSNLKPVGFETGEALFRGPAGCADGFQCVREHSILQEKFLFLDLSGWEKWRERSDANRFEIRFELDPPPFPLDRVDAGDFTLFATPAVNIFPHKAKPISLQEGDGEYPVIPEGGNTKHFVVYSIESVTGIVGGSSDRIPLAASGLAGIAEDSSAVYQEIRTESLLRRGYEISISVKLPWKTGARRISSLSVELLCSNGLSPVQLRVGDIHLPRDKSPDFVTFVNCTPVTRRLFDAHGDNRLWRPGPADGCSQRAANRGDTGSCHRVRRQARASGHDKWVEHQQKAGPWILPFSRRHVPVRHAA